MNGVRRLATWTPSRSLRAGATLLVCFASAFACESEADDCAVLATCEAISPNDGGSANSEGGAAGSAQATSGAGETGSAGASGASGEGGAGGERPECDPSAPPSEDACVLDEALGVFVSPEGDDDEGDGSRSAPFKTLSAGILAAADRGRRVYACTDAGAYEETLALDEGANGIELFGGLSCEDFSYTGEKAVVTPPGVHTALVVAGVDGVRVEDFTFVAADAGASDFGVSSIGAFVTGSSDVKFRRVRLQAGRGGKGKIPERDDARYPATSTLAGRNASGPDAGGEKVCECQGSGTTIGGAGGDAYTLGQAGEDGFPDHGGGEGGRAEVCDLEAARGADAPALPPAPGAAILGELTADGWIPRNGASGEPGQPGQGGGGGGAITVSTNPPVLSGGGGGGCGGCGGVGGPGGGGGGGSIALASFESSITIEASELVATDAGHGGNGRMGQAAQIGRGEGGESQAGCRGGQGGFGAAGAAGGGGAGGISAGVLFRGERPRIDLFTSVALGQPGLKGAGGKNGENDGISGVARAVLEVP